MKREEDILKRLKRRLASTRATVMLEFAFVAPLVAFVAIFAADFTRILRTEQQLEIATRLAADVEAHVADYHEKGSDNVSPSSVAKRVSKFYLVKVANVAQKTEHVYTKGGSGVIKNPISVAIDWVAGFVNGTRYEDDSLFLKILGKIFGGILNFVTFRTVKYLTEVVPHDREVRISTAAYIPTILPADAYGWLGLAGHGRNDEGYGMIGVCQFAPDLKSPGAAATAWNMTLDPLRRHRVYCYMPVIDSVPVAPQTYVRIFKSWCAKQTWAKGLID